MNQQQIEAVARKIRKQDPTIGWVTAWNLAIDAIEAIRKAASQSI